MDKKRLYEKCMPGKIFFLILLLLLSGVSVSYGREITRMELEEVTDLIMSPGCNYIYTLTNCPSAQAEQMRELIKDRLRKGESKEEILSYFEKVYGTKILAQPSKKGFYFVAWWFPYFLLLDIFIVVGIFLFLWRRKNYKKEESDTAVDQDMETLLEDEVRKFKERE